MFLLFPKAKNHLPIPPSWLSVGFVSESLTYLHHGCQGSCSTGFQLGNVDADVTVNDEDVAFPGTDDVFVMEVAEIDFGCGVCQLRGLISLKPILFA